MKNNVIVSLVLVLGLAIGALLGYCLNNFDFFKKNDEPIETIEYNPIEVETDDGVLIVTKEDIDSKLFDIAELATQEGRYTVKENTSKPKDTNLPGILKKISDALTTNIVEFECEGIVKFGIKSLNDINIDIDQNNRIIYIQVPEVEVLSNYILWDTVKINESDNLLHPIDSNRYIELITRVEELGLDDVVNKQGIKEKAQDNLENIIERLLSPFDGYEIKVFRAGENDDK